MWGAYCALWLSARRVFRATLQTPASEEASWEEAMFNSVVLDLATGLVFRFLTVSLATGTIVEAIASFLALRAKTLRIGIGQLLNDSNFTGLAKQLYDHAAVNPRGSGSGMTSSTFQKTDPAYIDRQLFGQAMLDILKISPQVAANPAALPTVADLKVAVDGVVQLHPDPQIQNLLHGIIERSVGDPNKIKAELVAWFDNAMDLVSGYYKRWTQLISFVVALILAGLLNVDAVRVATVLWEQPKLVEQLKIPAATTADTGTAAAGGAGAPASNNTGVTPVNEANDKDMLQAMDTTLPIGWQNGRLASTWRWASTFQLSDASVFFIALTGWLITALSTLFGARFWFDLLQNFIRLKGTGPSPVEKVEGKGAAT
jgi:hypothetical protein